MKTSAPIQFGLSLITAMVVAFWSVDGRAQTVITNLGNVNDGSASFDPGAVAGLQFHTGVGGGWNLSQVTLPVGGPMRWDPSGTGGILYSLSLYASTAGLPATPLAVIGSYSFTDPVAWSANATFTPGSPIALQSNSDYWLILRVTTDRPGGIWEGTSSIAFISGSGFSFGPSVFTHTDDIANVSYITGFTHFAAISASPAAIPEPAITSASLALLVLLWSAVRQRQLAAASRSTHAASGQVSRT